MDKNKNRVKKLNVIEVYALGYLTKYWNVIYSKKAVMCLCWYSG